MAFGAEIAELIVALRLDDKGFSGKLNGAQRNLKGFNAGLSQINRGAGQVGQGIDKIATRVAIAGAGLATFAVTTAASFETAFTGIEKTVDATDAQFAELEATIREMARTGLASFEELASIGETGGALGIATESIDEFIDVVARLGMSTDLSVEQAATALGQLGNVLGLSGADYEAFSDILVALGNDGASTEGQIIDLAARFGAAGNAAGLTNEQILALASTTASMGIEAEAGGGALSRVFNNLTLDMATASDEGQLLASTLGMSLDELKSAWDQDAGAVFEDLLSYINELDQFEGAEFLSNLGITNTRDINAIRLLSQGVGEYRDQLETAESAQGALREESDKFLATSERQWFKLQQNVRDAAATIGAELLPIVNEVVSELVGWLQEPGTQKGIKEFAENLAGGVRDLVREIKSADFGPLIQTLKGAAGIAKVGFDAFNALPSGVKSLALAAFGINKLTGGALGDIAKGFGNIFAGGLKILFERGSPTNPMFVVPVGGTLGGAAGGAAAAGGLRGLLGNAFKLVGVVAVAEIARQFAPHIDRIGQDLHEQWGIPDPPKWLTDFLNMKLPDPFASGPTKQFAPGGFVGSKTAGSDAAGADTALLAQFGGKLDKLATDEVLKHLGRTTEIGLKGVGTSFQQGLTTGLDPIGDVATRILARAEDPKAPAVMAEIKGHIAGLEEIQAAYLATGDVKLAAKVQTNIDTLHGLIGTVDTVRAATVAAAAGAASSDRALLGSIERTKAEITNKGNAQLAKQAQALAAVRAVESVGRIANSYNSRTASASEITSRKRFDPKITTVNNITVPVTVAVNASVIQQQVYRLRTETNSGGFI